MNAARDFIENGILGHVGKWCSPEVKQFIEDYRHIWDKPSEQGVVDEEALEAVNLEVWNAKEYNRDIITAYESAKATVAKNETIEVQALRRKGQLTNWGSNPVSDTEELVQRYQQDMTVDPVVKKSFTTEPYMMKSPSYLKKESEGRSAQKFTEQLPPLPKKIPLNACILGISDELGVVAINQLIDCVTALYEGRK